MTRPSHNSVVVVWRPPVITDRVEEPHVLLMKYRPFPKRSKAGNGSVVPAEFEKIPGGGMKPGESPAATAVRELYEETGLIAREKDLVETCSFPQPVKNGIVHTKYGLAVRYSQCRGTLHTVPVTEQKGVITWLGWVPISEALEKIKPSSRGSSQHVALLSAQEWIRNLLGEP